MHAFFERHRTEISEAEQKVTEIAAKVFKFFAAAALFIYNSSIFAIGFTWAILSPSTASFAVNRIVDVWRVNWASKALLIGGGIFAWPMGANICCLFVGVQVSLYLQEKCRDLRALEESEKKPSTP
jgi:hypothetical protein